MTGRFIAVVGPSGVGKDSVMAAVAQKAPTIILARRVITRPTDAGGEDFDGVTEDLFAQMQARGDFALSWPAHGLHYAIPNLVDDHLMQGRDVLANLSRAVLLQMQARFNKTAVIALGAERDVLASRLTARGREDAAAVARRLARSDYMMPEGVTAFEVDNSGPLDVAVGRVLAHLYPDRG